MVGIFHILTFAIYATFMLFTIAGIPILLLHIFMLTYGAAKRAHAAEEKVRHGLMDGESMIAFSIEKKPYALFSRRSVLSITNSRVLYFERPILGGFKMVDIQWKDVIDAELSQNILPTIFGSTISVIHSLSKRNIKINIACESANTIYRYAQKEEQSWEEKRRVRALEETRASAGGTYITSPAQQRPTQSENKSVVEEIKDAKDMLDQGIISDVEFDELKSKILVQGRSA